MENRARSSLIAKIALVLVALVAAFAFTVVPSAHADEGPEAAGPALDSLLQVDLEEGVELGLLTESPDMQAADMSPFGSTLTDDAATLDAAGDAGSPDAAPGIEVTKGCGSTYSPGELIEARIHPHYTGWHSFSLGHGSGSQALGTAWLNQSFTYYLRFRVYNPTGSYELQMTVPNILILYRCQFNVGQAAPPPPPSSGPVVIDAAYTANDYLQPRSCFAPGSRIYFVARVKNLTGAPQQVVVRMMSRGAISNWWPHKIEVLSLAPYETRTVYAYTEEYPVGNGHEYQVDLFRSSSSGWVEMATAKTTFRVGSCQ
jgi:hypothetical protein